MLSWDKLYCCVFLLVLTACAETQDEALLDFLIESEPQEYDGDTVSEKRVQALQKDIASYQQEVDTIVQKTGQIASFQKQLAYEFIQRNMYGPALAALEAALLVQTDNEVLYYLAGLASARSSKTRLNQEERQYFLEQAKRLYLQALAIAPNYKEALYGITVLLSFELGQAENALTYARTLRQLDSEDISAAFLLANVLVRTDNLEEAADMYKELADLAPTQEQKNTAIQNYHLLAGEKDS